MNEITLKEFAEIFKYIIENNKKLISEGKNPITIAAEGPCGVGKTTQITDLAKSMGMTIAKINLAELEEISDLVGFPLKEFRIKQLDKNTNEFVEKWVPADLLQIYSQLPCEEYEFTGDSRMGYATPAWLPRDENPNGTILLIDDYTRANSLFMQACMELINTGKYVSWSLPKNTSIALTTNPDNGSYSVTSLDSAQKSRFINFNIKFDIDNFAEWAENYGLDSRAINFAIYYANELFDPSNSNHLDTINPRSYTTFTNAISGISDWSKPENLALILNISKGCFHDEENYVGGLFTNFIANKLDKLISPEDLLLQKWDTVKPKIEKCVYDGNDYHPEIAAVLSTRLLNYSLKHLGTKGTKSQPVQERLIELVENSNDKDEKMLFSEDLLFNVIKTVVAKHSAQMNKLLLNPQIRKKII